MNTPVRTRSVNADKVVRNALAGVTTTDAISSVYYANRLLDFRKGITIPNQNLRIPGVASEPSDRDVDIAWKLIREIEQAEKTKLQSLNENQVKKYVIAFSRTVGRRTQREYKVGNKTRQNLIKKATARIASISTNFTDETLAAVNPRALGMRHGKLRGQAARIANGKPKKPHSAVLDEAG